MNTIGEKLFMSLPINIGRWQPYGYAISEEQYKLQIDNLIDLPFEFEKKPIKMIYTTHIAELLEELLNIHSNVTLGKDVAIQDEAYSSSVIEGAKVTRLKAREIYYDREVSSNNYKSERMVLNVIRGIEYVDKSVREIDCEFICNVWNIVIDDVCENIEIKGLKFRDGDVRVGTYIPPMYERIPSYMESYCKYYNGNELVEYVPIRAILLHLLFEMIHPYCDGNGRTGRILFNKYLVDNGYNFAMNVSITKIIHTRLREYYMNMRYAENIYNDITPFIEYMLEIMVQACEANIALNQKWNNKGLVKE